MMVVGGMFSESLESIMAKNIPLPHSSGYGWGITCPAVALWRSAGFLVDAKSRRSCILRQRTPVVTCSLNSPEDCAGTVGSMRFVAPSPVTLFSMPEDVDLRSLQLAQDSGSLSRLNHFGASLI